MKIMLGEKIHNPIMIAIVTIVIYICSVIVLIPAIPYAMIKGACNLDYYEEWFDFIDSKVQIKAKSNE